MKNILVLNYEFPPLGGGGSPVSYEISKGYAFLGYSVDVITMAYGALPKCETKDGLNIYRVKSWRSKKEICHPWEQLIYLFSAYFKVKELMKNKKYDICHTHFIIPTGILAFILKIKFGLDYIITAHGSDVLGYNPRFTFLYFFLKGIWNKIIKNSKSLVSPSDFLKKQIEKNYGKDEKKFFVVPNGVSKDKFIPMKKEKYILIVSRLFVNKGVQDFIEGINNLELGDWKVKIVGDGPYRNELVNLVNKYKLSRSFEFLGWIDNKSEKLKDLYGKASIFCQPSHFENASIVLLEALQSGCTILARDVGGNSELLGKDSLFNTNNELRMKLNELITDYAKLGIIQEENKKRSIKYDWENIVKEYEKILLLKLNHEK